MAGKTISKSTSQSLIAAFVELGTLLLKDGRTTDDLISLLIPEVTIEAKGILEQIQDADWKTRFNKLCCLLEKNLCSYYRYEDKTLTEKQQIFNEIIVAVEQVFLELCQDLPDPDRDSWEEGDVYISASKKETKITAMSLAEKLRHRMWRQEIRTAVEIFNQAVLGCVFWAKAADKDKRKQELSNTWSEIKQVLQDCVAKIPDEQELESASQEIPLVASESTFGFSVSQIEIGEPLEANSNTRPFTGVLFPNDTPSESPPAVGPPHCLLVPTEVARQVVAQINASRGLPLDIDPSLAAHCNTNVTGIMTSAAIDGNNTVVYGHLFDHNKPEEVNQIVAQQDKLGMSVSGMIVAEEQMIQGRKISVVKSLKARGAAILEAAKATWKTTQVLQAQGSSTPSNSKENPMTDNNNIVEQIKTYIDNSVVNRIDQNTSKVQQLEQTIQAQGQKLTAMELEKQQRERELQAQQERDARNKEIVEAVATAVDAKITPLLQAQGTKSTRRTANPQTQPVSLTQSTVPLVANSGAIAERDPQLVALELEASRLNIELKTLSERNIVGSDVIAKKERLKTVNSQITAYTAS